jgi:hypothetical protein
MPSIFLQQTLPFSRQLKNYGKPSQVISYSGKNQEKSIEKLPIILNCCAIARIWEKQKKKLFL